MDMFSTITFTPDEWQDFKHLYGNRFDKRERILKRRIDDAMTTNDGNIMMEFDDNSAFKIIMQMPNQGASLQAKYKILQLYGLYDNIATDINNTL